jgi:hypothetical protein
VDTTAGLGVRKHSRDPRNIQEYHWGVSTVSAAAVRSHNITELGEGLSLVYMALIELFATSHFCLTCPQTLSLRPPLHLFFSSVLSIAYPRSKHGDAPRNELFEPR